MIIVLCIIIFSPGKHFPFLNSITQDNFDTDLVVDVTVHSNSAIVGNIRTVNLLYKTSARQMVPYILPLTCLSLNFEVCDQSGDDFVLYE